MSATTQLRAAQEWLAYARRELSRGDTRQAVVAIERAEAAIIEALERASA